MQLNKLDYLSAHFSPRNTLIASQTQVYKLEPKEYDQQVSQLVQGKQFELALQIAVSRPMPLNPNPNSQT